MRIERAINKLRLLLSKRGITSTVSGLAAALALGAALAAPAGLAASVTAKVLTAAAANGPALLLTKLITMAKIKTGLVSALIVAGVATPLALQHQALTKLRGDNEALRQQLREQAVLFDENQQLSNQLAQAQVRVGCTRVLRRPRRFFVQ